MDNEILNILSNAYKQYGRAVFCNPLKLNMYLHDLLAEYPNERKKLAIAVTENFFAKMLEVQDKGNTVPLPMYIDQLVSSYGMSRENATSIVNTMYETIKVVKMKEPAKEENKSNNEEIQQELNLKFDSVFEVESILKKYNGNDPVLNIPEGITKIDESVCKENGGIEKVLLPKSIKHLGDSVFEACTNLKEISFSDGLLTLGNKCFKNCKAIDEVTLPETVTKISAEAFRNCVGLKKFIIPKNVEVIEKLAFTGCDSLKEFVVADDNPYLRTDGHAIYTKDMKTLVCFAPGSDKEYYKIPDTVTYLSDNAFSGCMNLRVVDVPAGAKKGSYCFSGCENLRKEEQRYATNIRDFL